MSRRASAKRPSYAEPSSDSDDSGEGGLLTKSPRKSQYFKHEDDTVDEKEASLQDHGDDDQTEASEYAEETASASDASASAASDSSTDTSVGGKRRKSSSIISSSAQKKSKYRKLEYSDKVASTSQSTRKATGSDNDGEEAVGKEYFVAKLPALPAGDTKFKAKTLHPNTMIFMRDLRENNERDWFQRRDLQYQSAKADFDSFVLSLGTVIRGIDDTIPELPVKDLTFRIYRDIRFSNDRTPYKTFLSAYFSRGGRKGRFAGYYFSMEPGDRTILACGRWQPPSEHLTLIRTSIAEEGDLWDRVLEDPGFIQFFNGKEGVLKTDDKLKTCPKGFAKDHERIEFLRLKSFNVHMKFSDEEVVKDGFLDILAAVITQMEPFVTLLNEIVYPTESGSETE